MNKPVTYRWDGEVMRPLGNYFDQYMRENFTQGECYDLVLVEQRSANSHKHFFAVLRSAWDNLPEGEENRFPTPEHLRKWALTYTPYCSVRSYEASSKSEAIRVAEFLQHDGQFSRVEIKDRMVLHYIPSSQAVAAMPGNHIFMASKKAVLIVLAQRLGVDVAALEEAGRTAA
jgi:hypothetical protein